MIDYDAHNWRDHLLDIKGSMVQQIFSRVATCGIWSALVTCVHEFYFPLAVPSVGHMLIGVPLGLLLVFRTNASYDRYLGRATHVGCDRQRYAQSGPRGQRAAFGQPRS